MSARIPMSRIYAGARISKTAKPSTRLLIPRRGYASTPKPDEPKRTSLASAAATGFVAGLLFVVGSRYTSSADAGTVKADGAPALEFVDTYGKPWHPAEAIEKDDPRNPMRIRMASWVKNLQDHIVTTIESLEASAPPNANETSPSTTSAPKFLRDAWIRPNASGEGSSCVLANGRIFEKAGVNVSIVQGMLSPGAQAQMRADHSSLPINRTEPLPYFATGLSIVIHPRNPHVPTVHLNYRYFEIADKDDPTKPVAWWFGGGSDLTPSYLVEEDAKHFHKTLKDAADRHHPNYWPKFKPWCDKYFYIPHRSEARGIGGFFFDDLTSSSEVHGDKQPSKEEIFEFIKDISGAFLPSYVPIVVRNRDKGWTEQQRRWQLIRRGRYVEFNLLYDRGTKFGLNIPGARVESILMSLPETARWEYCTELGQEQGTEEAKLLEVLKTPKDWA
ncbi:Coproporphyrinogen III oxidase [Naematelia encephala]|uniref:coproporphyrinogen oxidase n=1 Tax=Naematelia encephala TaxID=71784 RepID=A0A1Y2BJN1_9TREE|nr:Coproporphyrinogen III oxidase [Naematelia encephala]